MKQIPYNLEAERAYLGSILIDPNAKFKVILPTESFYDLNHQIIYKAILEIDGNDLVTLSNHLKGKIKDSYLASLMNAVPTSQNIKEYAEIVKEKFTRRTLIEAMEKTAEKLYEDDLDQTLSSIKQHILKINSGAKYEVLTNPNLINEWYENYNNVQQFIKTGIATIDKAIGGYTPTDFGLILADTNVGKTTFLLNMALAMAQTGKNVLFFSLEMTANQLNDKLIAMFGKHNAYDIRMRATQREQLFGTVSKFSSLPLTIVHKGAITSHDVVSEAYNRKLQGKVDVVMVDYIQRLSDKGTDNETMRMKNIAQNLKNFALINETPVISPAQVDKASSQGGKIKVENVAWAKSLADEADMVVYLYEKELNNKSAIPLMNFQIEKELRARIVKSRHSEKGQDFLIDFDRSTLVMKDFSAEVTDSLV